MTKYEVNINTLLDLGLGFEAHFLLYCLYNKDNNQLLTYIKQCKKINTEVFKQLAIDGYLEITKLDKDNIYTSSLLLTEKGKLLFKNSNNHPSLAGHSFDDFRNNYPSSTKGGRRLHSDLPRCRKLYNEIIKEIPHEVLCKCARLYTLEKKRTNSEEFMQALSTWLHQKNYQQYVNDEEQQMIQQTNKTNYDAI